MSAPLGIAGIARGRFTAKAPDEFVVFLLGMRINDFFAVSSWLPAARSMPKMLKELAAHPELGMLHAESFLGYRTFFFVQYWESFAKLEAFARGREHTHVPAWREFNQHAFAGGKVGLFHETYMVRGSSCESIYVNMPAFGITRAFEKIPVARAGESSGKRIGQREVDEPAVPRPDAG